MSIKDFEVPAENLHTVCDPDTLGFETTDEVAQLEGTIGQERALSALELAVDVFEAKCGATWTLGSANGFRIDHDDATDVAHIDDRVIGLVHDEFLSEQVVHRYS